MAKLKRILFLTGTRADFGKLKPLMLAVDQAIDLESHIFVTGMHTLARYGLTVDEVKKTGLRNIYTYVNQYHGEPTDLVLANTIHGLSRYVHEYVPDMIVVHGDRVETLAGAVVGALRNVRVAHIEGGELSGTVDELLRHAVTKLSHIHFVANGEAASRLQQLGEIAESIHVIGSPDIDVMLSSDLPTYQMVKERYEIPFDEYGILMFHPVTTDLDRLPAQAQNLVEAVLESRLNMVVIYPNNDEGCQHIFEAYKGFDGFPQIRIFPSMRFEYFITLLKHSSFILGNSSAGVREAPVFPVVSINIGSRQRNRHAHSSIINVDCTKLDILEAIGIANEMTDLLPSRHFGNGDSVERFMRVISGKTVWSIPVQKEFADLAGWLR